MYRLTKGPLLLRAYGRYHPKDELDSPIDVIFVAEVVVVDVILVLILLSNHVDAA